MRKLEISFNNEIEDHGLLFVGDGYGNCADSDFSQVLFEDNSIISFHCMDTGWQHLLWEVDMAKTEEEIERQVFDMHEGLLNVSFYPGGPYTE